MFGVTVAPEKTTCINKLSGMYCVVVRGSSILRDDLVIHGKGIEQHDERLFVVLNW